MKVHTIEIAGAIERELKTFLKEWGGGYPMRFTRFVDIGGRQTDLHVYEAEKDLPPWMVIRIKSVMRSEQGECIQYFVHIVDSDKKLEEVMVSPEIWKLPALADKVLNFSRNTLLTKIGGGAIEGGATPQVEGVSGPSAEEQEEIDYDSIDTSGILASDSGGGMDFDPADVISQANSGDDMDPSDLIKESNEGSEKEDEDGESGFNPEDVIKD